MRYLRIACIFVIAVACHQRQRRGRDFRLRLDQADPFKVHIAPGADEPIRRSTFNHDAAQCHDATSGWGEYERNRISFITSY